MTIVTATVSAMVSNSASSVEVVVVGAGISGIRVAIELLRLGCQSFVLLEAAAELGGTWRDNTYPGIAVDILSVSYCFPFETDFAWSREFAPGAEIQRYVRHCADKYGVLPHIRYQARVLRCVWDAAADQWTTHLADGGALVSRYVVAATGLLSQPKLPDIAGLETFAGTTMHTARWDHSLDLRDRRVAIVGTGASAVQIIPKIAQQVAALRIFQRTPIWVSPRLDRALRPDSMLRLRRFAVVRGLLRWLSELGLELVTFSIVNYQKMPWFVQAIQHLVRAWMRTQVDDPAVAARLLPQYGLGCKRPTTSNTYLKTFNLPHVQLVTEAIARIVPQGVITADGALHDVDTLILATGFLTTEQGNGPSFKVIGQDETELGQFWQDRRLQAYAGVAVPGFANFFLTAGPYSGGFNWFTMLEAHVSLIGRCLGAARSSGMTRVQVKLAAHQRYMQRMWSRSQGTVFTAAACQGSHSYYIDRHGDASLPLPHTPWWRALWLRWRPLDAFEMTAKSRPVAEASSAQEAP